MQSQRCFVTSFYLKKSLLLATGANYRQKVLIVLIIDLLLLASLALTYKNDKKTKISGEVR
jgi:hypothetical protein